MAFLTGYVLPKAYYEKVGAEGFEKKPIGTGPYMVDAYEGNAFLRLKANPTTGAASRLRDRGVQVRDRRDEPRRGDRERLLRHDAGDPLRGVRSSQGQAGPRGRRNADLRHRHDLHLEHDARDARQRTSASPPSTRSTRRRSSSACCAATACRWRPWRRPNTRPTIQRSRSPTTRSSRPNSLKKSGYSPEKPVTFTIQTTRGFKPKDYEMIQAIVGMWRKVGIAADIESLRDRQALRVARRPQARAHGVLQLGQCDRRPDDVDGLRHVRPLAALRLEDRRARRHDAAALGRKGRGQAHRGLEGRRQAHRRGRAW